MSSAQSQWDEQPRYGGHHLVAAVVAAVCSVGLHIGAGLYLSDLRVAMPVSMRRAQEVKPRRHLRLREIKRSVLVDNRKTRPGTGPHRASRDEGGMDVKALALAPDMVIMALALCAAISGLMPSPSRSADWSKSTH